MDNRINEIRRKISVLRAEMMELEGAIRNQIKLDLDCSDSAMRLMAKRQELTALIGEWKAAGGGDRLPTVEVRLKENHRSSEKSAKPRPVARR
jgi:chorismate mutase